MSKVTINLPDRNLTLASDITNSDAFFFLSLIFNDEEQRLLAEGRHQEASDRLAKRQKQRLDEAANESDRLALEEKINGEIAISIYHQIDNIPEIRGRVARRLVECFPDLPEHLVYYESTKKFGIRLSIEEVMELFVQIVSKGLKIAKETTSGDRGAIQSATVAEVDVTPSEIERLKAQIKQLEESRENDSK